ncbi:TadG family pilus assembly protein [Plastoroseomonas hellenica]|uniref:TadG family pilus assembly protein n=1 Tax=Plastoroseomonas hellenica TaxID=2687306 RepID=UPI001BAD1408|nr:TadG family pilus assembly protein [Plastoroseomonas hellenica]MBR0646321.1 hypothetical protein [Plastoroseomonas hellenica]
MTSRRPRAGLWRERRGATAIIVALAFTILAGATALATDASLLQWQKRRLQAAVDAAALSAVRTPAERQAQRATEAVTANGFPTASVTTQAGTYTADPSLAVSGRFVPGGSSLNAASAVQVQATTNSPVTLMRLFGGGATTPVAARAIAAHQPMGAFTIGSGLVAANTSDASLLNPLLGGLLGTALSLNAVDYNALLVADVNAFSFLDRLAIATNLTAGNYASLLQSVVGVGTLLGAAANALSPNTAQVAARNLLLTLAANVGDNRTLRLGDLLALGGHASQSIGSLGDDASYTTLGVSAFELLQAAAAVGGRNQAVQLGTLLNVPLAQVTASLTLIEPPAASGTVAADGHVALGPVGVRAHTSQLRLTLDVRLLNLDAGLVATEIHLPIMVEVAAATGTLSSITCGATPTTDTAMTVAVETGAVAVGLGSGSASAPQLATIGSVRVYVLGVEVATVQVRGRASVAIGQGSGPAQFSAAQIAAGTPQRISATSASGQILGGLMQTLELVPVLGNVSLDLLTPILNLLSRIIGNALNQLDPLLIGLLNAIGVTVGYADVRPDAARCGVVALVR